MLETPPTVAAVPPFTAVAPPLSEEAVLLPLVVAPPTLVAVLTAVVVPPLPDDLPVPLAELPPRLDWPPIATVEELLEFEVAPPEALLVAVEPSCPPAFERPVVLLPDPPFAVPLVFPEVLVAPPCEGLGVDELEQAASSAAAVKTT